MITAACCFWDANPKSFDWSRSYDESWVEKLYRGFKRNLTQPFRFIVFTEKMRDFSEPDIEQEWLPADVVPHSGSLVEPYRLGVPMIMVGLDTVITGNIDHLADYCLTADKIALSKDPYNDFACTGTSLVPAGFKSAWAPSSTIPDDMVHMRRQPHIYIEDRFPGQVLSYKAHVKAKGGLPADARIVYFHGRPKMPDLPADDPVKRHWL